MEYRGRATEYIVLYQYSSQMNARLNTGLLHTGLNTSSLGLLSSPRMSAEEQARMRVLNAHTGAAYEAGQVSGMEHDVSDGTMCGCMCVTVVSVYI